MARVLPSIFISQCPLRTHWVCLHAGRIFLATMLHWKPRRIYCLHAPGLPWIKNVCSRELIPPLKKKKTPKQSFSPSEVLTIPQSVIKNEHVPPPSNPFPWAALGNIWYTWKKSQTTATVNSGLPCWFCWNQHDSFMLCEQKWAVSSSSHSITWEIYWFIFILSQRMNMN